MPAYSVSTYPMMPRRQRDSTFLVMEMAYDGMDEMQKAFDSACAAGKDKDELLQIVGAAIFLDIWLKRRKA